MRQTLDRGVRTLQEVATRQRNARIAALKDTTGWDELEAELNRAEARYWKRHQADVKIGKPIDQRELDYMRGKFDAIKTILKQPDKAAAKLVEPEEADQSEE